MGSKNSKNNNNENNNKDNIVVTKEIKEENKENTIPKPNTMQKQKTVNILIPLNSGYWEKSYNIETPLNQIASDYLQESNISFNNNYYLEWTYKNNPIEMNLNPLKSIVNEDTNQIYLMNKIKPISEKENLDIIVDIVGKPFSDPFEIFIFEPKKNVIKTRLYNQGKIKEIGLNKYGVDSAYCNANNHLYISGGVDQSSNESIGLFWDIDLKNNLFNAPITMFPKKNHSMIYIEKKVYIIGGDDVNTSFYDEEDKDIKQWSNLNNKRFEPSLIKHNDYLLCFDTSQKYNNFSNVFNFEKINLKSKSAEWELVNPQISPVVCNYVFSQKFFGVVEDLNENIIFVGGMMDNNSKKNDISNNGCMNIQYNINNNFIEKSNIEFKEISFNEKTFLPLNNNTYFILPDFNKRYPKVIYFYRDKNFVEINEFHTSSLNKVDLAKIRTTQIKPSLNGLIFDQPTSHRRNSKSSIDISVKIPCNGNKLNNNNILFSENVKTVTEDIRPEDVKIDIITKNNILTSELNNKDSLINNSKISLLKTQKEEKKNEPKKEGKVEENKSEKENKIKQYQTQVINENDKYVNYQFYYIEEPVTLVKFHSCNYTPLNEISNNNTNYNKRKNAKIKDIILPKTIDRKTLKRKINKIGIDHIKTNNY